MLLSPKIANSRRVRNHIHFYMSSTSRRIWHMMGLDVFVEHRVRERAFLFFTYWEFSMTGYVSIRIECRCMEQKPNYSDLIQGLANFFCKEFDSKYCRLLQVIQS